MTKTLGELSDTRYSFGLYAPTGLGKTLQSFSFVGEGIGKAIAINVETGAEDAPGGLATLLHCDGIYPHLTSKWLRDTTLVMPVKEWGDMQTVYATLKRDKDQLVKDGYTTLVLDGGSALSYCIRLEFTKLSPEVNVSSKRHTIIGSLVSDVELNSTSLMELSYYDVLYDRYMQIHNLLKQLPFTFVTTFLEDEVYDPETRTIKVGRGARLIGKKLPSQIAAEFDGFFHCEIVDGKRMWLTTNDPTELGNMNNAIAKHRFGNKLAKYEEANGVALMKKINEGG